MLGKLIKYEIKATARMFLPLYVVLVAFAVINKIFMLIKSDSAFIEVPQVISMITYGVIIVAIMALTVVVMIQRFYKNLVQNEGYLMHTLPVKKSSLIKSKLIVSLMWIVLSIIITVLTSLILAFSKAFFDELFLVLKDVFTVISQEFGAMGYVTIAGVIFVALFITAAFVLMIYASISIGQLFNKNRGLASFGAYIVLNIIEQTIGAILIVIIVAIDPTTWNIDPIKFVQVGILGMLVLYSAYIAAYYFISKYVLTKKLNLE